MRVQLHSNSFGRGFGNKNTLVRGRAARPSSWASRAAPPGHGTRRWTSLSGPRALHGGGDEAAAEGRDNIPQRADLVGWRLSLAVVIGIEGREFGQAPMDHDPTSSGAGVASASKAKMDEGRRCAPS